MNATELLANTLSPGTSFFVPLRPLLPFVASSTPTPYSFPPLFVLTDAHTRDDATQKLESAARENFVTSHPYPIFI
ncbi:hypothetical protein NUW54_g3474 [Trametes sanguinea]|uniref:Uncharacterized protein n=1 Tax=Trametes sanguinea TaxID=158606 RepID=A0ACC1Q2J4_9APHY|nr:hypothetical protein NUW54_g3474 [Trametes sanguinea]